MGACSSCLGRTEDRDQPDQDEQSRLLFDDPHSNQYGSLGNNSSVALQADPQEVQRENEALLKVVSQTSNHLVDIFAMVPPTLTPPTTTIFPAQDARLLRYQEVLAKISASESLRGPNDGLVENATHLSESWMSDDDDDIEELKGHTVVKSEGIGPLLGGFADVDSAL